MKKIFVHTRTQRSKCINRIIDRFFTFFLKSEAIGATEEGALSFTHIKRIEIEWSTILVEMLHNLRRMDISKIEKCLQNNHKSFAFIRFGWYSQYIGKTKETFCVFLLFGFWSNSIQAFPKSIFSFHSLCFSRFFLLLLRSLSHKIGVSSLVTHLLV